MLDGLVPVAGPLRVLVLYPLSEEQGEQEWLHAASSNPAFDCPRESEEDICALADGEPFCDEV